MKRQSVKLLSLLFVSCLSTALISCETGGSSNNNLDSYDISIDANETDKIATDGIQYVYEEETNSYAVSGYIGYSDVIYIPAEWNELPVTKINYKAFTNDKFNYDTIIIPSSVYYIEGDAFYYTNVDRIIFNSTNIYIKYDAFFNCSSMTIVMNGTYARFDYEVFYYSSNSSSKYCNLVLPLNFDFNESNYNNKICSSSIPFSIYYMGTEEYLNENSKLSDYLTNYTVYYYSEELPPFNYTAYKYWHFDEDGYPVSWSYLDYFRDL